MGTKQIAFPVASMKNMKEGRLLKFQGISDHTILLNGRSSEPNTAREHDFPFHAPLSDSIGSSHAELLHVSLTTNSQQCLGILRKS